MPMQDPDDVAYRIERFREQIQNLPEAELLKHLEASWESVQMGMLMQDEVLLRLRERGIGISAALAGQRVQLERILQKLGEHGISTTGGAGADRPSGAR